MLKEPPCLILEGVRQECVGRGVQIPPGSGFQLCFWWSVQSECPHPCNSCGAERSVPYVTHSGSAMKSRHSVSIGSHPKQCRLIESASSCSPSTCFLLPWFQILGVSLELILGMLLPDPWGRFLLVHLTQPSDYPQKDMKVLILKSLVEPAGCLPSRGRKTQKQWLGGKLGSGEGRRGLCSPP